MIPLTAARTSRDTGPILAGDSIGRVHSVFVSAMNIQVRDGGLITLLTAPRCLYPRSILLTQDISFAEMGFLPDLRVTLSPCAIDMEGNCTVTLETAETVSLSIPPLDYTPDSAGCKRRLAALAHVIFQGEYLEESLAPVLCSIFRDFPYSIEHNVWSRFLLPKFRALYDAICNRQFSACREIGGSIAGCGPGLTPASDDFLTGVFAALYGASSAGLMDKSTAEALTTGLSHGAVPKTGIISAGFLKSGAHGQFSEDIIRLITAFFAQENREDISQPATDIRQTGSTSGPDTLAGIWFGLAACFCPIWEMRSE